ncbi:MULTISPECIES: universal stress protein [Enterococcus]|uniref:Universal stress protein n=1 Tax=Enterococcus alcedinis TaxID=1274384 RepID=A0A917JDT2_9ENTE|nr:universal stress protein [Enterococcus alcedinis]MBP2101685.1 nucleotide-binding universal stress UspA family protein [Enterococcus alcedinis]GGI64921.1 universal stress protein [Enterococcus alcedinis]
MEQTYKKILVGVDGSEHAMEAFRKAVEVARRNEGEVIVTMIIEQQMTTALTVAPLGNEYIEEQMTYGNDLLERCRLYAESVNFSKVTKDLVFGQAKSVLAIELPKKHGIDLIMVGQSGLNRVETMMVGSVANYVIRKAPCDVLVVTQPENESESTK